MHLKRGWIRFACTTEQLNLLVVSGRVGSYSWWVGLDRVTQSGPMDSCAGGGRDNGKRRHSSSDVD